MSLFRWHDHLLFGIQEKAFAHHMGMVFHNCTKLNGYNIFKGVEVKPPVMGTRLATVVEFVCVSTLAVSASILQQLKQLYIVVTHT